MSFSALADRLRTEPVLYAQALMDGATPTLYITFVSGAEKQVQCKTLEGAQGVADALLQKPIPCRLCGNEPKISGEMVSCMSCSIHVGTRAAWTKLMKERMSVSEINEKLTAPLKVCKLVALDSTDEFLQNLAQRAVLATNDLDMSSYFTRSEDAKRAEETIRKCKN